MQQFKLSYSKILSTLSLSLVVFGVGGCVWAADITPVSDISYVSTFFLSLMSWAWTIPAIAAGQLMSNDLIYGQLVGLTSYMYQLRNLIRTIANFSLVAIIVTIIGQIITNGGKAGEVIKKYGVRLLVSGILINASRFLMGALVDISTVAIAAVGGVGSSFMTDTWAASSDTSKVKRAEGLVAAIPDKIMVDSKGCITNTSDSKSSKSFTSIMANQSTVTGPLIFLGAGLMKLQGLGQNIGCESNTLGDLSKVSLKIWVSILMIVMFVVPLIVLAAFNLFRLLFIWGWIICSPLIVLLNLFEDEAKKFGIDSMSKYTSRNTIISGLFQPVFTVGAMVVGMMLVTGIYRAVDFTQTPGLDSQIEGIRNKQSASSMSFGEEGSLGSISMVDVVVDDPTGTIGGGFGYIIMSFAVCFVLWMLVKMSFEISKKGIGQAFDAQKMMGTFFDEFSKNMKMPDLGLGTPLEGASLAETMKFMNPETNQILKATEDYGKKRAKSDSDKASQNMEAGIPLLQKNGFLSGDELGKAKNAIDKISYNEKGSFKDNTDWQNKTNEMFGVIKDAASKSDKQSFIADHAGRNTYDLLKDWYEKKGGKQALTALKIKDPLDKEKTLDFTKKDFDSEMNSTSYLGAFINEIAQGDKVELDKIKAEKLVQQQGSKIDFKDIR